MSISVRLAAHLLHHFLGQIATHVDDHDHIAQGLSVAGRVGTELRGPKEDLRSENANSSGKKNETNREWS